MKFCHCIMKYNNKMLVIKFNLKSNAGVHSDQELLPLQNSVSYGIGGEPQAETLTPNVTNLLNPENVFGIAEVVQSKLSIKLRCRTARVMKLNRAPNKILQNTPTKCKQCGLQQLLGQSEQMEQVSFGEPILLLRSPQLNSSNKMVNGCEKCKHVEYEKPEDINAELIFSNKSIGNESLLLKVASIVNPVAILTLTALARSLFYKTAQYIKFSDKKILDNELNIQAEHIDGSKLLSLLNFSLDTPIELKPETGAIKKSYTQQSKHCKNAEILHPLNKILTDILTQRSKDANKKKNMNAKTAVDSDSSAELILEIIRYYETDSFLDKTKMENKLYNQEIKLSESEQDFEFLIDALFFECIGFVTDETGIIDLDSFKTYTSNWEFEKPFYIRETGTICNKVDSNINFNTQKKNKKRKKKNDKLAWFKHFETESECIFADPTEQPITVSDYEMGDNHFTANNMNVKQQIIVDDEDMAVGYHHFYNSYDLTK